MSSSETLVGSRAVPAARAAERFAVLDSWRGIAAIMVVLFHAPVASHVFDLPLVRSGALFVDFFFVLSGFVITNAYAARLATPRDAKHFVVMRVGRLLPLHLVMLGLFVVFECAKAWLPGLANPDDPAFSGANAPVAILTNLLMLQSLGLHDTLTWNTPSWSISAEFVVYGLFALAALASGRRLWIAALAGVAASLALLIVSAPEGMESAFDFGAARALYGFSIGVLLHRFCMVDIGRTRAALAGADHDVRTLWTVAEVAVVVCVATIVVTAYKTPLAYAAPFVFAFAIHVFAHEAGLVSALLRKRGPVLIGELSFSIYLVHMFVELRAINVARLSDRLLGTHAVGVVGNPAKHIIGIDTGNAVSGDFVMLAIVAATVALSFVTYRLIEAPTRLASRRLAEKMR